MRVCLPDLADTVPAVIVGMISAFGGRSPSIQSNPAFFNIDLGPRRFALGVVGLDDAVLSLSRAEPS